MKQKIVSLCSGEELKTEKKSLGENPFPFFLISDHEHKQKIFWQPLTFEGKVRKTQDTKTTSKIW